MPYLRSRKRDLRRLRARHLIVPTESGSKAMITRERPIPRAKARNHERVRASSRGPPPW